MKPENIAGLDLLRRCLKGDATAIAEFQAHYGPLIYGLPTRLFRLSGDEAGDFYVFALEGGRVFRRARSYAARTSLRSYLAGYVLGNLVLEWRRTQQRLSPAILVENIDDFGPPAAEYNDGLNGQPGAGAQPSLQVLVANLSPERSLLLRLLYIEDFDFQPEDIRRIAEASHRAVGDIIGRIDAIRQQVREREAVQSELEDQIASVHSWLLLYDGRLRWIDERLQQGMKAPDRDALHRERAELQRKQLNRRLQIEGLRKKARRRQVTAPYEALADLLGVTLGTISSQIRRLRQDIAARANQARGEETPLWTANQI